MLSLINVMVHFYNNFINHLYMEMSIFVVPGDLLKECYLDLSHLLNEHNFGIKHQFTNYLRKEVDKVLLLKQLSCEYFPNIAFLREISLK